MLWFPHQYNGDNESNTLGCVGVTCVNTCTVIRTVHGIVQKRTARIKKNKVMDKECWEGIEL